MVYHTRWKKERFYNPEKVSVRYPRLEYNNSRLLNGSGVHKEMDFSMEI